MATISLVIDGAVVCSIYHAFPVCPVCGEYRSIWSNNIARTAFYGESDSFGVIYICYAICIRISSLPPNDQSTTLRSFIIMQCPYNNNASRRKQWIRHTCVRKQATQFVRIRMPNMKLMICLFASFFLFRAQHDDRSYISMRDQIVKRKSKNYHRVLMVEVAHVPLPVTVKWAQIYNEIRYDVNVYIQNKCLKVIPTGRPIISKIFLNK